MPQATAPSPQTEVVVAPAGQAPTVTEMYEAARLQRRELQSQQSELQGQRRRVREQLNSATNPADIKGLEGRLVMIDQRIADVEKQLASADALVATRAANPGVVIEEPSSAPDPTEIIGMGMGFSMVLLFPLSIAYARRLWRRSSIVPPTLPPEFTDRMANLERGVEAIAIEVERLGEGQRFVTQVLSEADRRRQVPALPSD
ncbi:MAG: hypothetical protein FJ363_10960 [Gemmatimonadetes bacterium]|nr:hypothetical protein [Gemmatimonadota bacterium]